jgi:hypothetical protein
MSQENIQTLRGIRYRVSLPSERASQRRTLDERLYVRVPALYRLIADRVVRLHPAGDQLPPGMDAVTHGRESYREGLATDGPRPDSSGSLRTPDARK